MNNKNASEALIKDQSEWYSGDVFRVSVSPLHPRNDGFGGFFARYVGHCPTDPEWIVGDLGPDVPDEWRLAFFRPELVERVERSA